MHPEPYKVISFGNITIENLSYEQIIDISYLIMTFSESGIHRISTSKVLIT